MGATAADAPGRLWQIDALRGLMLVLMTVTHVPTRLSSPFGQPFGFVSAAEGFVFLSAFMAGLVYTRRERERGPAEMRFAFLKRVLRIYLAQAALLFFLFSAVAMIGLAIQQPAITNLVSFYLQHPVEAIAGALLLVYNPPLLDILPMYILFMLASSLLLAVAAGRGWGLLLGASVALWAASQFGLGHAIYDAVVAGTGFDIPSAEIGAFNVLAWQLLWMLGLWLGALRADGVALPKIPLPMVVAAAAIALVCLVWRHALGQAAFPGREDLNMLFDKWQLGPLRLLDLLALIVLTIRFAPQLERLPRWRPLETLGTASLPVFCAHLVIALLALALLGEPDPTRPLAADLALLVGTFAALYAVALLSAAIDRRSAQVQAAYKARRARRAEARALSAAAPRSPTSRSRSRPR